MGHILGDGGAINFCPMSHHSKQAKKRLKVVRNIFIFNLAFSDMILGASVPFTIMVKLSRQFPFQPFDISCRYTKIFFRACIIKQIQDIKSLTLSWQGYKNDDIGRGRGGILWPPLKSVSIKPQKHVRGQNRGSGEFPVHLDYFQVVNMCISRVFTLFL